MARRSSSGLTAQSNWWALLIPQQWSPKRSRVSGSALPEEPRMRSRHTPNSPIVSAPEPKHSASRWDADGSSLRWTTRSPPDATSKVRCPQSFPVVRQESHCGHRPGSPALNSLSAPGTKRSRPSRAPVPRWIGSRSRSSGRWSTGREHRFTLCAATGNWPVTMCDVRTPAFTPTKSCMFLHFSPGPRLPRPPPTTPKFWWRWLRSPRARRNNGSTSRASGRGSISTPMHWSWSGELMMPTPFCNHTSRPHDVGSTAQLRHVSATFAAGSTAHGANSTRQEKVSMLHYSASRRCRSPTTEPESILPTAKLSAGRGNAQRPTSSSAPPASCITRWAPLLTSSAASANSARAG